MTTTLSQERDAPKLETHENAVDLVKTVFKQMGGTVIPHKRQQAEETLYCTKHHIAPLDVWYDCDACCQEVGNGPKPPSCRYIWIPLKAQADPSVGTRIGCVRGGSRVREICGCRTCVHTTDPVPPALVADDHSPRDILECQVRKSIPGSIPSM